MALTYSTVFGRLGRLMAHAATVRTFQATLDTQYASTVAEWSGGDVEQIAALSRNLRLRKIGAAATVSDLQASSIDTLIDLVDANFTITTRSLEGAMRELIRSMIADSKTIDGNTVSVASTAVGGSNTGSGTLVVSAIAPVVDKYGNRPGNLYLQNARTETLSARCLSDQTASGTDEQSERFTVEGQRAVDRLSDEWPTGSGKRVSVSAVSSRRDGGRGVSKNIATNSDYLNWTSNVPNHWVVDTGTPGTHIDEGGVGFAGTECLKFVGDGSTAPKIHQRLRVTAETLGQINPDRPYTISFAAKYATAAPTATLRVSVQDSSGNILNTGTVFRSMEKSVTSGSMTTSFQLFTAAVWSPSLVPKGARIVVETTSNLANTSQVYVADLTVAEMRSLGPGLPAVQMIPGADAFRVGDTFTAAVTNNLEGGFAKDFDRFYDMGSLGLALPGNTAGGENINDSLIA